MSARDGACRVAYGQGTHRQGGVLGPSSGHDAWVRQRQTLAAEAERWTGNRTQVLELSRAELASALDRGEALISSLRRDGRVLVGPPAPELFEGTGIGS